MFCQLELKNAIPGIAGGSGSGADGSGSAVVQLKKLMLQVNQIKDERERLETELKTKNCDICDSEFFSAIF